ncbi:MAG: hypothetical protein JW839_02205 [Candidatus Lokiarchaeota archaeon]|nr:hypothetical protein [Candidatus Lokiarchaeota archaeon]
MTDAEAQRRHRQQKAEYLDVKPTGRHFARNYHLMTARGMLRVFKAWVRHHFNVTLFKTQEEMFLIYVRSKRKIKLLRLLLLEPREHGKTELNRWFLAFCLYEHPFWNYRPLCVYMSANPTLNKNCAQYFRTYVFKNPRIRDFYGDLVDPASHGDRAVYFRPSERLPYQSDPNFKVPATLNLTGMHVDVLMVDDPLDETCRRKPTIIDDWINWHQQDANSVVNDGGMEVIIGTRKMRGDFYQHIEGLKTHICIQRSAILTPELLDNELEWHQQFDEDRGIVVPVVVHPEKWRVLWQSDDLVRQPDGSLAPKWTLLRLLQKLIEIGWEAFECEYQNNPQPAKGKHYSDKDLSSHRFEIRDDHHIYRSDGLILNYFEVARELVATWDPTGNRDKNKKAHHTLDFSAIVLGFCWKGDYYVLDFRLLEEADPEDQVQTFVALRNRWKTGDSRTALAKIEKSRFAGEQQLELLADKGIYIADDDVIRQNEDKLWRINATCKGIIKTGHLWWRKGSDIPTQQWLEMKAQWIALGNENAHDDGPDATEMFIRFCPESYVAALTKKATEVTLWDT